MKLNSELAKLGISPEVVGVGVFVAAAIGTCVATVGNFQSWAVFEKCNSQSLLGITMSSCNQRVIRQWEKQPGKSYKLIRAESGIPDIKGVAVILGLGCGLVSIFLNGQIADTLLQQEEEEFAYAKTDEELKLEENQLSKMVEQRALKLNYAAQAKEFEKLYQLELGEQYQEKKKEQEPEESGELNADKLLGWLLQRGVTESSTSKLSTQSIFGKHYPVETLRPLLDELVAAEGVEWLNQEKTQFKMLIG